MGCGASVSQSENSEEQIYQNEELNRLLQVRKTETNFIFLELLLSCWLAIL